MKVEKVNTTISMPKDLHRFGKFYATHVERFTSFSQLVVKFLKEAKDQYKIDNPDWDESQLPEE